MPVRGPSRNPAARRNRHQATHSCGICKTSFPAHNMLPANLVRENIGALISARVPGWDATGFICRRCLNSFRVEFVRSQMEKERGELSALEEEVMTSLREGQIVADDVNREFERGLLPGVGENLRDHYVPRTRWLIWTTPSAFQSRSGRSRRPIRGPAIPSGPQPVCGWLASVGILG
jgi:hypothetical protein